MKFHWLYLATSNVVQHSRLRDGGEGSRNGVAVAAAGMVRLYLRQRLSTGPSSEQYF